MVLILVMMVVVVVLLVVVVELVVLVVVVSVVVVVGTAAESSNKVYDTDMTLCNFHYSTRAIVRRNISGSLKGKFGFSTFLSESIN